jgi:hypothetical protein
MDHAGGEAGVAVSATSPCDAFISYGHGDRPKAAALAKALEDRGLAVWWDPDLHAGDTWAREIEEAVEAARSVVVLWSAESVESRWVNAEARAGLEKRKLVPVRLDGAEPPLVFREIQWRSFAGWDGEGEPPGIEKLVEDIQAAIARSTGGAPGPAGGVPRRRWPWPAIAALAAGLALGAAAVGADLWGAALEKATDVVVWSGFPLPPLAMQVAALGLAVLFVARHRRQVWPLRAASLVRVLTCGLALALGLGVLYDWARQALGPKRDSLEGHVHAVERHGIRVQVLDSIGLEMSAKGEAVDDGDGYFYLKLRPELGDRPRRLVMKQGGCDDETFVIRRREWRSRSPLEVGFTCRRHR